MDSVHPIRIVARRTGMSPHLIRMWERRYTAIKPDRTSTGRRLYSEDDIERLILLRRATLAGESIGQIANLDRKQLLELIPREEAARDSETGVSSSASAEHRLAQCLQAMKNLDAVTLETRLLRASVSLGQRAFLEKLLHPLLELTGDMWSDGRLKVAHEHLAAAVIRSLLGSMYLSDTADLSAPLIISTTPTGQLHEFGALMASVTAATSGWRTLYLGPNLPAEDIVETARERRAGAIALSVVYPVDDPRLTREFRRIHETKPAGVTLLVGGRAAHAYDRVLTEIGATRIGGLDDLRKELVRLKKLTTSALLLPEN